MPLGEIALGVAQQGWSFFSQPSHSVSEVSVKNNTPYRLRNIARIYDKNVVHELSRYLFLNDRYVSRPDEDVPSKGGELRYDFEKRAKWANKGEVNQQLLVFEIDCTPRQWLYLHCVNERCSLDVGVDNLEYKKDNFLIESTFGCVAKAIEWPSICRVPVKSPAALRSYELGQWQPKWLINASMTEGSNGTVCFWFSISCPNVNRPLSVDDPGAPSAPQVQQTLSEAELTSEFIKVSGCGHQDANGVFHKSGVKNGRSEWKMNNRKGYAIVWNVEGCGCWGLYEKGYALQCQLYFTYVKGSGVPLKGWRVGEKGTQPVPCFANYESDSSKACHCPKGHLLKRTTAQSDTILCDYCGRDQACNSDMLSCDLCDFNICATCAGEALHQASPGKPRGTRQLEQDLAGEIAEAYNNDRNIDVEKIKAALQAGAELNIRIGNGKCLLWGVLANKHIPENTARDLASQMVLRGASVTVLCLERVLRRIVRRNENQALWIQALEATGTAVAARFQAVDKVRHARPGDLVRLSEDLELIQQLAEGSGGWNQEMAKFCGKEGMILKIHADLVVKVLHFDNDDTKFYYSPFAVTLVEEEDSGLKDDVVSVAGSGIQDANSTYFKRGKKHGRPYWTSSKGKGYAIVWNVEGSEKWGLFEQKYSLSYKVLFGNDQKTWGVPTSGWLCTSGSLAPPTITACPRGSVRELAMEHRTDALKEEIVGACNASRCLCVREVHEALANGANAAEMIDEEQGRNLLFGVLANKHTGEESAIEAAKALIAHGAQVTPTCLDHAFQRVTKRGESLSKWEATLADSGKQLRSALAVCQALPGKPLRLCQDVKLLKLLAKGHGGWKDDMEARCGTLCALEACDSDYDVKVSFFDDSKKYYVSPLTVTLVHEGCCLNVSNILVQGCAMKDLNGVYVKLPQLRNGRSYWAVRTAGVVQWTPRAFLVWNESNSGSWGLFDVEAKSNCFLTSQKTYTLPTTGWQSCGRKASDGPKKMPIPRCGRKSSQSAAPQFSALPTLKFADAVCIDRDVAKVRDLAPGYGEWTPNMEFYCGKHGLVTKVYKDAIQVQFDDGNCFFYNFLAVTKLPPDGLNDPLIFLNGCQLTAANGLYKRLGTAKRGHPEWKHCQANFVFTWKSAEDGDDACGWGLYDGAFKLLGSTLQTRFLPDATTKWQQQDGQVVSLELEGRWANIVADEPETSMTTSLDGQQALKLAVLAALLGDFGGIAGDNGKDDRWKELADQDLIDGAAVVVDRTTKLGEGGLGIVFKGTFAGAPVAVKAVRSSLHGQRAELVQECKALSLLKHPNVVQVFGVCQKDSALFILMELCPRGSLEAVMRKQKSALQDQCKKRLSFCIDQCNAISYLHMKQVLHGDYKPGNVLVTDDDRCKLCDFGLAQFVTQDSMVSARGCTLLYAAHEVLRKDMCDLSSDIFSLGACLFEVICLCDVKDMIDKAKFSKDQPFFGQFANFAEHDAVCKAWPSSQALKALQPLIRACWQAEPSSRPKVDALRDALQDAFQKASK